MTLTVDHRFRGPTTSGNGGYVAGLIAHELDADEATVTLRAPVPLDVALDVSRSGTAVRLTSPDDLLVAEGSTEDEHEDLVEVEPVSLAEGREISRIYPGLANHPFPECFVCGPDRAAGNAMRLAPGRIGDGRTACVWDVAPDLAGRPWFVWAALDCPGGWSAPLEGRPMVLGRMTGHVAGTPEAGDACVVMGRLLGGEGRKVWTATTVYGSSGQVLGRARATWITLPGAG